MDWMNIRKLYGVDEMVRTDGHTEDAIRTLEERVGNPLPLVLRKYYLDLGLHPSINYVHNRLLGLDKIQYTDDDYFVFYEENQGVVEWGVKKADMALENPPVWGNYGAGHGADWYMESRSMDDFLLLMAIYNGVMGGLSFTANSFRTVDGDTIRFIQDNWKGITDISTDVQKVYTNDYLEVLSLSFDGDGKGTGIFIGTNNSDRFEHLLEILDVEWSYISSEDE